MRQLIHLIKVTQLVVMFLGMEQIMHGWQMVRGSSNAITQGDSAVTVTDTGTDGNVEFKTDNTVRWNINNP